MKRVSAKLIIVATLLLLNACAMTKAPMDNLRYAGPESQGKKLVIALRGLGGSVNDFENYGFVEALHAAYPNIDLICPNAHFGYYRNRSLLPRLLADIYLPAKAQGYEEIYLVGVSLGGLGTLLSLREYPDYFEGAFLLAPFSGEEELHDAVKRYRAGRGEPPWQQAGLSDTEQSLAELWQWFLAEETLRQSGKLWLAFGEEDRLSGHDLLSELLPEDRVIRRGGEHKAEVFVRLWRIFLQEKPY